MNNVDQLKEDLKQAEIAYQMTALISQFKGNFLARIAHELRSPISSIMGLHQLILNNLCESPEEEREFIEEAFVSTKKLLKIIDEIITISKLNYGKINLTIAPLSLTVIFADLYQFTHLQAANRNLRLEFIPPEPELYVLADLEKFIHVFINLIDTAINLIQEGTIKIVAEADQELELVKIFLDIPCPFNLWQQDNQSHPITSESLLSSVKDFSKKVAISPSLKFLLAQTLIELMGGQLKISSLLPENFTQIQCLIPLASESVAQE